jgi:hypothetical protein
MEKTAKEKKVLSPKAKTTIYISIMVASILLLVVLTVLVIYKIKENGELVRRENELREDYNRFAREHEDINDPDFAIIYFDDNGGYIPNEDLVIKYNGK